MSDPAGFFAVDFLDAARFVVFRAALFFAAFCVLLVVLFLAELVRVALSLLRLVFLLLEVDLLVVPLREVLFLVPPFVILASSSC